MTHTDYVNGFRTFCTNLFDGKPFLNPRSQILQDMMEAVAAVPDNAQNTFDKANEEMTRLLRQAESNPDIDFKQLNQDLIQVFQNALTNHTR